MVLVSALTDSPFRGRERCDTCSRSRGEPGSSAFSDLASYLRPCSSGTRTLVPTASVLRPFEFPDQTRRAPCAHPNPGFRPESPDDERISGAPDIETANRAIALHHREDVVFVPPSSGRHENLNSVVKTEQAFGSAPVSKGGIERRQ